MKSTTESNITFYLDYILQVEGMTVVPKIIPILKQASCYDNNLASYMLSTLYSGGVGITPDKYKVRIKMMSRKFVNKHCL